jgi:hypothetical protein
MSQTFMTFAKISFLILIKFKVKLIWDGGIMNYILSKRDSFCLFWKGVETIMFQVGED